MKRLLVLGAAERARWLESLLGRIDPKPRFGHAESANLDCDSLLVVDDGGTDGFAAIQSALALREARPGLPIAVVRTLDGDWPDHECLTRSRCHPGTQAGGKRRIGGKQLSSLMGLADVEFDVSIDTDAITFEYHE